MHITRRVAKMIGMPAMLAVLFAGCATKKPVEPADPRSGDVAVRALRADAEDSYRQPQPGEDYFYPYALPENTAPQYPAQLLGQRLPPVVVRVRLIVDEGGGVAGVSRLDPESTGDPAFFVSVQEAARTWQFSPLVKKERAPGRTELVIHGVKEIFSGKATALPFHQDYEFTFTQRDGKGFVSGTGVTPPSRPDPTPSNP